MTKEDAKRNERGNRNGRTDGNNTAKCYSAMTTPTPPVFSIHCRYGNTTRTYDAIRKGRHPAMHCTLPLQHLNGRDTFVRELHTHAFVFGALFDVDPHPVAATTAITVMIPIPIGRMVGH